MYNYVVTRQYGGQNANDTSYGEFLVRITDIIGVPATCAVALAIFIGLILFVVRRKITSLGARNFALAAAVFLLYYVQIGGFPRSETRFTLPAVPFLLLMAAPCFALLRSAAGQSRVCCSRRFYFTIWFVVSPSADASTRIREWRRSSGCSNTSLAAA